jgi:PAS domain-containing protein
VLFPYLPLRDRATVGPWELIPRNGLEDADATSAQVAERVRGLMRLYRIPGNHHMGAFVRLSDGRVGDSVDRPRIFAVGKSVLVAMLDTNPELTEPLAGRRQDGHRTPTADHALLFGHSIGDDGRIVADYGQLVTRYEAGLNVDRPEDFVIAAPIELGGIVQARLLNVVYGEAAYDVLTRPRAESRRVSAAIEALDFIWRNTTSITRDARIIMIRTAFEELFGRQGSEGLRRRLHGLLDVPDAPTTPCECGNDEEMTALECWALCFSKLRDKITHGTPRTAADYAFRDVEHFWLGEAHLRQAIKKTIAAAGHDEVFGPTAAERAAIALFEDAIQHDLDAGIDPWRPPE